MEPITPLIIIGGSIIAAGYLMKPNKKKQEARDIAMSGMAMQLMANAASLYVMNDKLDRILEERGIEYDATEAIKKLSADRDCSSGCSCDGESKSV